MGTPFNLPTASLETLSVPELIERYHYIFNSDIELAAKYDKLKEERDLLIEALEKCIVQFEGIAGYGNLEDNAAIHKAKELLNNLKK